MVFTSKPVANGIYRIKVLSQNLYLEAIPQAETSASTPWIRLAEESKDSNKQKWVLFKVPNTTDQWSIESNEDQAGLILKKTSETYRGHGFPYPGGNSITWQIVEYSGQYSKISAPINGSDVFDSQYRNQRDDSVHFWAPLPQSQAPLQCYTFELLSGGGAHNPKIDILFVQDATGSQQPYIDAARDQITQISVNLRKEGDFANTDDLRFGLIAFRDHAGQDSTFITQSFDFTSNIELLKASLSGLRATGGGDGPEAQCHALEDALNAPWRDDACKVVYLITDSPPHGVEPAGSLYDGWPNGCPQQVDPVRIVELMKDRDIILNVIPCEPTLSGKYTEAHNFYKGLIEKTGGNFVPLGDAQPLQTIVTGCALKALDTAHLCARYQYIVQHQAFAQKRSADYIAADLHARLSAEGVHHHHVSAQNIYQHDEQGNRNAEIWARAKTLHEAKQLIGTGNGKRIATAHSNSGIFAVTSGKAPITRDNVNSIVAKALLVGQSK